jgi:hypothetical protein
MEITLGMVIATTLAIGAYYLSIQRDKEKQ